MYPHQVPPGRRKVHVLTIHIPSLAVGIMAGLLLYHLFIH